METSKCINDNLQEFMDQDVMYTFPPIQASWYLQGLPMSLIQFNASSVGCPLSFFPLDVLSKVQIIDEPFTYAVEDAVGYIDEFGRYTSYPPERIINVAPGERVVTILFNAMDPLVNESLLAFQGYWELIFESKIIQGDVSYARDVTLTYGLNLTDAILLSFAIGQPINGDLEEVLVTLNEALTQTFEREFDLQEYLQFDETINFGTNALSRRLGLYQFNYYFQTSLSEDLLLLINNQIFDPNSTIYYSQSSYVGEYATNMFQQIEVVQPEGAGAVNLEYNLGVQA